MSKKKQEQLKNLLNSTEMTDFNRGFFSKIYPEGVDSLTEKKLDHALSQCERTVEINKNSRAVAKAEFDKLDKETQALVLEKFPNLLTAIFDNEAKTAFTSFLAELSKQKADAAAQVKANQEKLERDKLPKIAKDKQNPKFESFDSLEEAREHFEGDGAELFDCGQGYYQDEATANVYIENSLYEVKLKADIDSAKQDRGDRLYWVDKVTSITFTPVSEQSVNDAEKAVLISAIASLESQLKLKKQQLNALK